MSNGLPQTGAWSTPLTPPPLPRRTKLRIRVEGDTVVLTETGSCRPWVAWQSGCLLFLVGMIFITTPTLVFLSMVSEADKPAPGAGAWEWLGWLGEVAFPGLVWLLLSGVGLGIAAFACLSVLSAYMGRQELTVTPKEIRSRASEFRKKWFYSRAVPLAAVTDVGIRDATGDLGTSGTDQYSVFVVGGGEPVEYGSGLNERDQEWLCEFIRLAAGCADRVRGSVGDASPVDHRAGGPLGLSSMPRSKRKPAIAWVVMAVLLSAPAFGPAIFLLREWQGDAERAAAANARREARELAVRERSRQMDVVAVNWAPGSGGVTVPMAYVPKGFALRMPGLGDESSERELREAPLDEVKNAPKVGRGRRYWGTLDLGPSDDLNRMAFIIDDARPGDVVMYLDADQDGDFSNNPKPLGNQGTGAFARALDLELRYAEGTETVRSPYRVWFCINEQGWRRRRAGVGSQCHRRGGLRLGGVEYVVVVWDNPADGDYSDDPVVIDVNRDGVAQEKEKCPVGGVLHIGEVDVEVLSISACGDAVELGIRSEG